jgi:hypothetical protein
VIWILNVKRALELPVLDHAGAILVEEAEDSVNVLAWCLVPESGDGIPKLLL